MTEVHRYKVVKMVTSGGNKLTYTPHGPEIVMGEAYDALMTRFVDVDNLRNEAEDVAERMTAQFDALAEAVGFTQSRCEQTGDSPLDCAQQLVKQRDEALEQEAELMRRFGVQAECIREHITLRDTLRLRLSEAEKKIDDADALLRRAKQMIPAVQYNWHANTKALLDSTGCADVEKL